MVIKVEGCLEISDPGDSDSNITAAFVHMHKTCSRERTKQVRIFRNKWDVIILLGQIQSGM